MMKQATYFLLFFLVAISCKEKSDPKPADSLPDNVPPASEAGTVEPVGTADGLAIVKTIGPTGGTIASSDGRFTVTVPNGALDKDVAISMQPITNTNKLGVGAGYRMLPDGQQFAKPVTMTFAYTDEEIEGSMPEALGIAYQNDNGVWMAVGGVQVDKPKRHLSIQVGHFTDFTYFESVYLDPEYKVLDPGQSTKIEVYGLNWIASDLPKGKEAPISKPAPIEYLDGWELKGEGSIQGTGREIQYFAPGEIPAINPALIIAKLKSPGKEVAQLISRVYVAPEGVSLQVGGGGWLHFPVAGANLSGGIKGIDANNGTGYVNIKWQGGSGVRNALGVFPWTPTTVGVIYTPSQGTEYLHLYGTRPDVSGGSLKVDYMRFGVLMGTFDVHTAGVYVTSIPPRISTSTMRGVFRVKCLDCVK